MQFSRLLLVSILLIIVVYLPSYSTLYYVSPEGNNNNNGRTPQTAWRNVSYATQQVGNDPSDPDSVFISPGVYNPGAGETFPVMVRSYTALIGLDTGVVLEANSDTLPVIGVLEETAFWIENLEITEGVIGILVRGCSHFGIHDNIVHHNRGRGVKIKRSKHFKLCENTINSNKGGGLKIDGCKLIDLTENTLRYNRITPKWPRRMVVQGAGISILNSRAIRVAGNQVRGNKLYGETDPCATGRGGGIYINGTDNITLLNNVIRGNTIDLSVGMGGSCCSGYGGGVYIAGCQAVVLRRNLIANNLLAIGGEYADAEGGGICVRASTITIRHNAIQDNIIGAAYWLHLVGGAGMSISGATEVIVQQNVIAENTCASSGCYGGGVLLTGGNHEGFLIGGEPGAGNDIYGNYADWEGNDLACFQCRDTVTATFNYFAGAPDPGSIYPLGNWDTRFWRDNSILENEPPHILDYFPTCAETTLYVGDSLLFWIESLDYDGDSTFTWWTLNRQPVAAGDSFLFVAQPQHVGYDTVQVNVTDGRAITSHEWYLEVIGERFASPEKLSSLPKTFALQGNYPNPFNLSTVIQYQLPVDCHVRLEVYDLLGRKVATLAEGEQEAGYRSFTWDASKVSSGIYIYKLTAGDFSRVKKMMLVK